MSQYSNFHQFLHVFVFKRVLLPVLLLLFGFCISFSSNAYTTQQRSKSLTIQSNLRSKWFPQPQIVSIPRSIYNGNDNANENKIQVCKNCEERSNHLIKNSENSADELCTGLPRALIEEIQSYENITGIILKALLTPNSSFYGRTHRELGNFVDTFGSRLVGSESLENSIDYMLKKMQKDGLENVHGEIANVPHWTRGEEKAELIHPRKKNIKILGLGFSVGTGQEWIQGEVIVVKSFEELNKWGQAGQVKGKIVVFNEEYISYGETVQYRASGASESSKFGAIASLIRSVTPFSLYTPHTGQQDYEANVTKIPTACLTSEDADLLNRLQNMGQKMIIRIQMDDLNMPSIKSRNVVGEITGRENPKDIVIISGHIDSWDVGQGALDDGGGLMISAEALALLSHLGLRPKRTLRAVLWTAEEPGLYGVREYIKGHESEISSGHIKTVFESDIGTFRPLGLDFSGTTQAGCIVKEVLKLLAPINATMFRADPSVGSDIEYFIKRGIPGLSLNNDNEKYFYYHHSEADTMAVEDPRNLDLCTAVWAISSYVIADLSVELPR